MPGPKSDKIWADAVHKAVHEYHEEKDADGKVKKVRYINQLALNLVKAGAKGDIQAIKEIGDRLDGKPKQAVEATTEVTHNYVARMPAATDSAEEWQKQHAPTTH